MRERRKIIRTRMLPRHCETDLLVGCYRLSEPRIDACLDGLSLTLQISLIITINQ